MLVAGGGGVSRACSGAGAGEVESERGARWRRRECLARKKEKEKGGVPNRSHGGVVRESGRCGGYRGVCTCLCSVQSQGLRGIENPLDSRKPSFREGLPRRTRLSSSGCTQPELQMRLSGEPTWGTRDEMSTRGEEGAERTRTRLELQTRCRSALSEPLFLRLLSLLMNGKKGEAPESGAAPQRTIGRGLDVAFASGKKTHRQRRTPKSRSK